MNKPLTINALGELEVEMIRTFDAPRSLVFDAWTKPELLRQWLGVQNGWIMAVCEIDLRVGGTYRYVWKRADGMSMTLGGIFREIVVPERIAATEKFEESWYPGGAVNTNVLEDLDGRTLCRITSRYDSTAARDAVLASPMESGVEAGYLKLDELLSRCSPAT